MRTVTATELKRNLRKYLTLVKKGEEVVICERGLPVAKLVPFGRRPTGSGSRGRARS
jgi:prevent-host-death family protein